jgi:nitroreductase
MDVYEALYTTRMMRRMKPDPIPLESQARILDAAIRAPNGGNAQRRHSIAVDDPALGHQLRRWGVAANRHPVHEVSSRNRWGGDFGACVPAPLWPPERERG